MRPIDRALYTAVSEGNLQEASDLFIPNARYSNAVPNVNAKLVNPDNPGDFYTILGTAVKRGDTDVVRLLIDKGADVNARDSDGTYPLFVAALLGLTEIAEMLIVAGADVNAAPPPLPAAAQSGDGRMVELLIRNGADVNNGCPLFFAAEKGLRNIVYLLTKVYGADIDAKCEGSTPLEIAKKNGHTEVVGLLESRQEWNEQIDKFERELDEEELRTASIENTDPLDTGIAKADSAVTPLFYICDNTGARQGTPVSREQLQELANQGRINPQTDLETENGQHGKAGQIRGLSFPSLYYVCDNTGARQAPPVSREQLQELANQGRINPQTRLEDAAGRQGLPGQLGISFPPPPIPSLTKEQLELMARNAEERYYAQARIIEDKEKELSKEISFSFSLGNEEDIDEGNHCRNIGDFFKVFVVQCLWFPFCFGCGTLITMLIIGLVLEFILPWTKYITGFVLVLAVGAAILVPIIAFIYRTYNMLIRVPAAIKQAEEQQASIRSERSGICVLLGDSCVSQRNLMGESHVSQSDLEKALEWYEKAVKLGNTNVQRKIADTKIKLGEHYCERGDSCVSSQDGGGKNYLEAALEWYEKASEMGNTDAQCKVETVKVEVGKNRCGMGDVFVLKGDFVQALEWYEKASEMGNTEALRKIDNNPGIQHAIQYEKSKSERERIERDIEKLREMGNESREWLNRRFR